MGYRGINRSELFMDGMITRGSREATIQFYTALNDKYPLRSWDILTPDTPLQHLGFTITALGGDRVKET